MALINRVSRLFRADFNAVLDHIEEPELLLRQSIRDMEDELADCDRRIARRRQEQASLQGRCEELESRLEAMTEQLDLCFDSGEENLARNLVRRRLETESLLKSLSAEVLANDGYIDEQQALLDENSVTLEGLRQKAEMIDRQRPGGAGVTADARKLPVDVSIHDDEVEIAFLAEKKRRAVS